MRGQKTSALGFLVVFGGVVVTGGIIARLLAAIFKWAGMSWLDRLMGAGVGFLRGMTIAVGIVTPLLTFATEPTPKFLGESQIAPYTVAFGRVLVAAAPAALRDQFENKVGTMKSLWKTELKKALPGFGKDEAPKKLKKESY